LNQNTGWLGFGAGASSANLLDLLSRITSWLGLSAGALPAKIRKILSTGGKLFTSKFLTLDAPDLVWDDPWKRSCLIISVNWENLSRTN